LIMTADAHYHRGNFDTFFSDGETEFRFYGVHPWQADAADEAVRTATAALDAEARAGVGEIGLDRLKTKTTTDAQRAVFARFLARAADEHRPVVLHGAKCWGEVYKACRPYAGAVPAFLFHGFSRSEGLVPEIVSIGGWFSVGPALLNDHAVNYRTLVSHLPKDRVLVESDEDAATHEATAASVAAALPAYGGLSAAALADNFKRFAAFFGEVRA